MIARAGSGWQTLLADLSLILFMVTASALSQAKDGPAPASPQPSPRSEPLAVWRAEAGAPELAAWLASQPVDARQQLSIVLQYRTDAGSAGQQAALAAAGKLLADAGAAGMRSRLVVEPGAGEIVASLAYDQSSPALARGLQTSVPDRPTRDDER